MRARSRRAISSASGSGSSSRPTSARHRLEGEGLPEFVERLALESVKQSLHNLRTFPCVRTLEERGLLALHGAYFSVMDGRLLTLDPDTGAFANVGVQAHAAAFTEPRF